MAHPSERRAGRRLFACWLEASAGRRFPSLDQVSRAAAKDLWDQSFVIDVRNGPGSYTISQVGQALSAKLRDEYVGQGLDTLPRSIADDVSDICLAAVASGKPVARGEDLAHMFGHTVSYRLVLLPVGQAEVVEQLIGTIGFLDRPIDFPTLSPANVNAKLPPSRLPPGT